MKEGLAQGFGAAGHTVVDLEAQDVETPLDYPDHAEAVGQRSPVTQRCAPLRKPRRRFGLGQHTPRHPRRVCVMTE